MTQPLDILVETPSQTAGPYVHIGCIPTFAGVEGVYPTSDHHLLLRQMSHRLNGHRGHHLTRYLLMNHQMLNLRR